MEAPVVVMNQADFDAWIQKEAEVSADPVQRGKKWAAQFACNACHSVDGSKIVGPTWKGLYGETVTLEGGATATADDAYLRESILNPNAMIVQGYPANVMPQNFKERLSEQQLADIIEYLKSLK
jgi:cytochrome c oxidase subunit 2